MVFLFSLEEEEKEEEKEEEEEEWMRISKELDKREKTEERKRKDVNSFFEQSWTGESMG